MRTEAVLLALAVGFACACGVKGRPRPPAGEGARVPTSTSAIAPGVAYELGMLAKSQAVCSDNESDQPTGGDL